MTDILYSVHSFQINIGVGDGAIHILCSQPQPLLSTRTVVRAILLDGGETSTDALGARSYHENILTTIKYIEDNFTCHGPENDGGAGGKRPRLRFDAFVVSHWDTDHCQGIMRFLFQDIRAQADAVPAVAVNTIKLKRALYDPTSKAPLSFFYAPSWKGFEQIPHHPPKTKSLAVLAQGDNGGRPDEDEKNGLDEGDGTVGAAAKGTPRRRKRGAKKPSGGIGKKPHKPKGPKKKKAGFMFPDAWWDEFRTDVDSSLAIGLPENAKLDIRARVGDGTKPDEWATGLLLVHTRTASLLGRNFFSKTPSGVGKIPPENKATDIDDLMTKSPPQNAGIALATQGTTPGMYCVAANGNVIGTAGQYTYTVKNRSSICLLVIWSKGADAKAAHRISHYLAGDAHDKLENAICRWIKYTEDDNRSVSLVKLSHHGASTSNPDPLWTQLKPQVIVASAGDDIGYGHPRWEILEKIMIWKEYPTSKTLCLPRFPPLFLTRYPCYIDPDGTVNPKALGMATSQAEKIFRSMDTAFEKFAKMHFGPAALADPISKEFIKDHLKDKKADMVTYILEKLHAEVFPVICGQAELKLLPIPWAVESIYVEVLGFDGPAHDKVTTLYDHGRFTSGALEDRRTQVKPTSMVLGPPRRAGSPSPWGLVAPEDDQEGRVVEWDEDSYSDDDSVRTCELLEEFSQTVLRTLADDDNVFRLVPVGSDPGPRPTDGVIPRKNPLHNFVTGLAGGVIRLETAPAPGSGVQMPFAGSDAWLWWFRNALGSPAARMFFTPTTWPLGTDAAANLTFRADIGSGRVLVLQTTGASKALGVDDDALARMYSETRTMAFGATIESPPKNVWSVKELAKFVGMDDSVVLAALGSIEFVPATSRPGDDGKTLVPCRNALWFTAGGSRFTRLSLEFVLADTKGLDAFRDWIKKAGLPQFSVDRVSIAVHKNWFLSYRPKDDLTTTSGAITFSLALTVAGLSFTAHLTFTEVTGEEPQLRLRFQHDHPDQNVLGTLFSWIASAFHTPADDLEGKKWTDAATKSHLLKAIHPRAVELTIPCTPSGIPHAISAVYLYLQVEVTVGTASSSQPLIFFLSFAFGHQITPTLRGSLWCPPPKPRASYLRALPTYDPLTDLRPILPEGTTPLPSVDLAALASLSSPLPKGIPSTITLATLTLSPAGLAFAGELATSDPPDKGLSLDRVRVAAACSFPAAGAKAKFLFSLDVTVVLYPGGTPADPDEVEGNDELTDAALPAKLRGLLEYVSGPTGHWRLAAQVSNLTGAHLASFFDGAVREGVLALVGHLEIGMLSLRYEYDAGGLGREFEFLGTMSVGELELNLRFFRDGDGTWEFVAALDTKDEGVDAGAVTLGDLIEGVMGGAVPELPEAVRGIVVSQPGDEEDLVRFSCSKMRGPDAQDGTPTEMVMFAASVHIAAVSLTFVQWRGSGWAKTVPSKRIVKVAVSDIGPLEAPLVGTIDELPFEELAYLWVSDEATEKLPGATPGAKTGMTKGEFDALLDKLDDDDRLFFKATNNEIADKEIVLEAGSHFMIIAMNAEGVETAVLDYVFARPGTKKKAIEGFDGPVPPGAPQTAGDKDVSKAPFKAAVGPITIENIGLRFDFKTQRLGVVLDATFLMGPIGLALIGFGLSVKLGKAPKKNPDPEKPGDDEEEESGGIPVSDLQPSLQGMAVSFDRPPVTVAGGFVHSNIDKIDCYAGGLIIGFKPYMIQAVGVYAKVPKDPSKMQAFIAQEAVKRQGPKKHARLMSHRIYELDEADEKFLSDNELVALDDPPVDTFTMFFVIFRVEGPLFSVGFADLSGLCGGIGINTEMRLPTAETVLSFPLIAPMGTGQPGSSPIQSLMALLRPPTTGTSPWFKPREDAFWFAAGLKATSFQILSVEAVVVFQLNPYLQLGIYGVALCDLPSIQSAFKFVHAELGVACTLDIRSGTFKLDAQLSPRSFILDPSCHLTGGMALYAWFAPAVAMPANADGSGQPGDWVLTVGGFHQAYNRPKAYPNPPRLGINWSLGGSLRISGEAYFAITPRVCMAGGKLCAALSLGALYAWFDAYLDMLINFEPFYFAAEGGVSVGVRFTLDLWFVTIRISVEIGAMLMVAGPPMAGMVHVDFWVFGFDIHFGGSMVPKPRKRTFGEFRVAALKSGTTASSLVSSFLSGIDQQETDDEDEDVWVSLRGTKEDAFFKEKADKGKTTKPFIFNCASGLVPQAKIKGQKETQPTGSRAPRTMDQEKKDIWLVQPGPFTFTVLTAFPSSKGTLKDERPGRVLEKQEMKKLKKPEYNNIFALPMQLTETLTSDITLEVVQAKEKAVLLRHLKPKRKRREGYATMEEEEDDEPGIWKVQPILKDVPCSLWGKYNDAHDPVVQGNLIGTLLGAFEGGGKKDKSTVQLVMGLTITPPPPHLSDDVIPKFNLVRDTKETVKKANFFAKETVDSAWAPEPQPSPNTPELKDNPTVPGNPDDDKEKERQKKELERWARVKTVWEDKKNDPEEAVRRWADRLGFAEGALVGKRPTALLNRFNHMVSALPMIAVGMTA